MLIFPLFSMFLTALISQKITKSWLAPGSFFAICWTLFVLIPLVFANEYKVNEIGLWFIAVFIMACSAGSLIAYRPSNRYKIFLFNSKSANINYNKLYNTFIILLGISFFGLYLLFVHALNTYDSSYYSLSWISIPSLIAIDRYSGDLQYPAIVNYSLYFIYPSSLLGGILFSINKINYTKKIFALSPLFAALLLGIIEGARSSILLSLIIFFSSWLSRQSFNNIEQKRTKKYLKLFIGGIFSISIFIFIFVLIQGLRQGMDTILFELLIDRIKAYFFGYLAAFTNWFNQEGIRNLNIGFTTFAGPFNLLGIMDRPLGFYEPVFISSEISTNIFTALRGLVTDFTILGSIIISFIIGFVFQTIYQKQNYNNLISTLPISLFYAFTLYSPLISIFHYNSIIFSWIIIFLILLIQNEYSNNYS
jgi:oligosaccharide repeat unit polymerase